MLVIRLVGMTASGSGALGELEHVGAQSVLSTSLPLDGWECPIGIDLSLKAAEEGLAGGPSLAATVSGSAPRDLGGDLLVDVLHLSGFTSLNWLGSRGASFRGDAG